MPEFWILGFRYNKTSEHEFRCFISQRKSIGEVGRGAFEICPSRRPLKFVSTFNQFQMLHKVQSAHRKLRQLTNVQSLPFDHFLQIQGWVQLFFRQISPCFFHCQISQVSNC